jgi:hypothetical protein
MNYDDNADPEVVVLHAVTTLVAEPRRDPGVASPFYPSTTKVGRN